MTTTGDHEATTTSRTPVAREPVHLRVDVAPDARGHLGQDHAPLDGQGDRAEAVDPGGHLGGGSLQDDYGFAIESGIPGNVSLAVNGHTFSLIGTGPRGWSRRTREAAHVVPAAKIPPPAGTKNSRDGRQAGRGPARHRAGAPARPRGRRQHALPRARAGRARDRAAPRQHRRRRARRDRRGLRELAGHDLVITSGGLGPTHDDRTVEAVAEVAGAELVLDEELLAHDRRHHGRRSPGGAAPTRRSIATATASRRSCRAARP